MARSRILLSYNPPEPEKLAEVLVQYRDVHHNVIIEDFEKKLARVSGARFAVALNSGTAAIHLGLIALGVRPGDDVLVSDFTYAASVNPILYLGARPVFIDSEPDTWNMDPELLEEAIRSGMEKGRKPGAILVVHVYGMPAKIEEIISVARRYEIPVLEDSAEALGAAVNGKPVGTWGEVGIFSFNNNKIVTTFGGGALVTDNEQLYYHVIKLAEQAREDMPYYEHRQVGYTYRMGPLNAAAGMYQLDELPDRIQRRKKIFEWYCKNLAPAGAVFLTEPPGHVSNYWLTTTQWPEGVDVAWLMKELRGNDIEARFLWRPMHQQAVFRDYDSFSHGLGLSLFRHGLSLPSGHTLTEQDLSYICGKIHDTLMVGKKI